MGTPSVSNYFIFFIIGGEMFQLKKKKPIVSIYPDYPIFLTLGQDFLRLCHLDP